MSRPQNNTNGPIAHKHIERIIQILKIIFLGVSPIKSASGRNNGTTKPTAPKEYCNKIFHQGIKKPKASGRLKAIKSHEMGDIKYIKRVPQQV
jgi:hypothetical protein